MALCPRRVLGSSCHRSTARPTPTPHACTSVALACNGPARTATRAEASASAGPSGEPERALAKAAPAPVAARTAPPAAASAAGSSAVGFEVPAGVAALVLLNCALFAAATAGKSAVVANLAINPGAVKWWAFITSSFVHVNLEQLSRNMFLTFFFSQMVYRELGAIGVWFSYLIGGVGANLSAWALLAGSAKAKAIAMLGLASSGGTLCICLAAVALSFRASLGYAIGASLALNFVAGVLLKAAPAAAPVSSASATDLIARGLTDPVGFVSAVVKGIKASALDPGNTWAIGAAVGALVVVALARFPDPGAAE